MSSKISIQQIKLLSLIIIYRKVSYPSLVKNAKMTSDHLSFCINRLIHQKLIFLEKIDTPNRPVNYFSATEQGKELMKFINLAGKVLEYEEG